MSSLHPGLVEGRQDHADKIALAIVRAVLAWVNWRPKTPGGYEDFEGLDLAARAETLKAIGIVYRDALLEMTHPEWNPPRSSVVPIAELAGTRDAGGEE